MDLMRDALVINAAYFFSVPVHFLLILDMLGNEMCPSLLCLLKHTKIGRSTILEPVFTFYVGLHHATNRYKTRAHAEHLHTCIHIM